MTVNLQWPPAVLYSIVFATLGFLVFKGVLHMEVLLAALTWLAPSPLDRKAVAAAADSGSPLAKTLLATVPAAKSDDSVPAVTETKPEAP